MSQAILVGRVGASLPGAHAEGAVVEPVGVDFGTATTLLAGRRADGTVAPVPLGVATTWFPSVARVDGDRIVVGESAEDGPGDRVIRSVKQAITQRRDTLGDVDADRVVTAVLAEVAERAAGAEVVAGGGVRLGCPAMWDGAQRRRLLRLAGRAGLAVAGELVDEPVAAGLAWLTHRYLGYGERPAGRLLVVDLGGGTVDIAVLSVVGGPSPELTVQACLGVATAGDTLDAAIARDLAGQLAGRGADPDDHDRPDLAWALLERAAREAKVRLSTVTEHPVVLPRVLGYPDVIRYRRERLEEVFAPQLHGVHTLAVAALRAARLAGGLDPRALRDLSRDELTGDVDHVLLVGGLSRIPAVAASFAAALPGARLHADAGGPPEEAVVAGLAGAGHERVGLHRPGFDLMLDAGGTLTAVYEAYTPLYEPWQLYHSYSELLFQQRLSVPAAGEGILRAVTTAGAAVSMHLDGRTVAGLPVRFGPAEVVVELRCDGRLTVIDGTGAETSVRALSWPAAGQAEHAGLTLWPAP